VAGRRLRGWRKIAASTWGEPSDPQIYGDLELDAGPALAFIDHARRSGVHLTLTHVVGKALAYAFGQHPDLNGRLHRGRFVQRETVDIFFIVSAEGGRELTGVKVREVDRLPAAAIAQELAARTERIHTGADAEFGKTKAMLEKLPPWALERMLRLSAWLAIDLDLPLDDLGMPRQAFGSALVSSVGMFGIRHAYAPLSPYYRVPLLVLVGEVAQKPVVRDGEVVIRPMVNLAATIDHRYLDGFHAARLSSAVTTYLADPAAHEPGTAQNVTVGS
jgi:hypothetical protein